MPIKTPEAARLARAKSSPRQITQVVAFLTEAFNKHVSTEPLQADLELDIVGFGLGAVAPAVDQFLGQARDLGWVVAGRVYERSVFKGGGLVVRLDLSL